ncbi:MAG: hypothetical protein J0M34_03230 [Alphaproteobacteria bacterium]|nr:hypothetical protein [Alphaproteobacteria bacterium]
MADLDNKQPYVRPDAYLTPGEAGVGTNIGLPPQHFAELDTRLRDLVTTFARSGTQNSTVESSGRQLIGIILNQANDIDTQRDDDTRIERASLLLMLQDPSAATRLTEINGASNEIFNALRPQLREAILREPDDLISRERLEGILQDTLRQGIGNMDRNKDERISAAELSSVAPNGPLVSLVREYEEGRGGR